MRRYDQSLYPTHTRLLAGPVRTSRDVAKYALVVRRLPRYIIGDRTFWSSHDARSVLVSAGGRGRRAGDRRRPVFRHARAGGPGAQHPARSVRRRPELVQHPQLERERETGRPQPGRAGHVGGRRRGRRPREGQTGGPVPGHQTGFDGQPAAVRLARPGHGHGVPVHEHVPVARVLHQAVRRTGQRGRVHHTDVHVQDPGGRDGLREPVGRARAERRAFRPDERPDERDIRRARPGRGHRQGTVRRMSGRGRAEHRGTAAGTVQPDRHRIAAGHNQSEPLRRERVHQRSSGGGRRTAAVHDPGTGQVQARGL